MLLPGFHPEIIPLGMGKRIARHISFSSGIQGTERHLRSFAARRFCTHLSGLDSFKGKAVLEIGGTDRISMEDFFLNSGADYRNVRLERNTGGDPRVVSGDFMDFAGRFDLVISLGVFELGAIDIDFDASSPLRSAHSLKDRVDKLASLTRKGGYAVIGTINAPCLFGDMMFREAGFGILHRESPFYTFMFAGNRGPYATGDRSELILLRKR